MAKLCLIVTYYFVHLLIINIICLYFVDIFPFVARNKNICVATSAEVSVPLLPLFPEGGVTFTFLPSFRTQQQQHANIKWFTVEVGERNRSEKGENKIYGWVKLYCR